MADESEYRTVEGITSQKVSPEVAAVLEAMMAGDPIADRKRGNACCAVPEDDTPRQESYEDLVAAMQPDRYWIRFFVRPCCPPPNPEGAAKLIARLKEDIEARTDFTDEQRAELTAIAEQRLDWYVHSGIRSTNARK